jgi:uncharacterized membrane protein YadS
MNPKMIYTNVGYEVVKKKYPNIVDEEELKILAPYATRMRMFFLMSINALFLAIIFAIVFTIFYFIPELYKSSSWPALFLLINIVVILFNTNAYFITRHHMDEIAIELEAKKEEQE